jgi:ferredoxin--NADP+ reductase
MIFAIGDVADPRVGLPYQSGSYVTNPAGNGNESGLYEVFDPQRGQVLAGTYVVGWARRASEGLVGIARQDAERGAVHVLKYLENVSEQPAATAEEIARSFARQGLQVVDKNDLNFLSRAEEKQARERGLASFKFADNESMLAAIEAEKTHSGSPASTG